MKPPSRAELDELADDLGLGLGEDELDDYVRLVAARLEPLERVAEAPRPRAPLRDASTDREPGYQPDDAEDPHNAWITRCRVEGAADGPLAGLSVGLKDTISLAGVELTHGSRVLEGYVPTVDATVVTRLLEAGATIEGKNNLWGFSMGASDFGPVSNPNAPGYSIGGSSSGTAAAVAAREVDIGIGGDQGGSIRIPASFGGLVGLKPTHGLVPYTGILGADASVDHAGPITRTVEVAARTLEAIAGRDGLDQRQPHDLDVGAYTAALDDDVSDLTVGVLREGFDDEEGDAGVLEVVRDAVHDLEAAGVEATEVSVPEHGFAAQVTLAIVRYGYGQGLLQRGVATGGDGWYDAGLAEYLSRSLAARSRDLPPSVLAGLLVSEHVRRHYGGAVYGKAQNLAATVRAAYDELLADVDALVVPTVPVTPPEPGEERGLETLLERGSSSVLARNTLPFNATHHPAITVPSGEVDGAPVGTSLVAARFDEVTLFSLAQALEQSRTVR